MMAVMARRLLPTLLAAATLTALAAHAGTLRVTVTGADGKPAADTVVLVQAQGATPPVPGAEPVVVSQKDIRFLPYVTVVPLGATVRFVNRDNFDHHVRSQPGGPLGSIAPAKQFEFRLAKATRGGPEQSADLKLDLPGTIVLGCHLHNSMRGHVLVTTSPWFAVTDDNGRASIEGVPDGAVEVKLWHPDQLVEQPAARVQVAGTASSESKLNFTPRKRPPPREAKKGEYDF
jgi:plastocyanin